MASLISLRSLVPSLSLFLFSFLGFSSEAEKLYKRYCANCHHPDRIGKTAPPLIPQFLRKKEADYLKKIIREGLPATGMPAFNFLSDKEIDHLIAYMKKPVGEFSFDFADIKRSYTPIGKKTKTLPLKNPKNLTVFVDKGASEIWLIEGLALIDSFPFKNVHGGVKFSIDGSRFYVPARDGWVVVYSVKEGRPTAKVRACVYLRNIALSSEGNTLIVSCVLPSMLLITDKDLKPIKTIPLKGRPSAIYEINRKNSFILTFRDKPLVAFLKGDKLIYKKTDEILEDFFIDPFERYIVGSSRQGSKLVVYDIDSLTKVYEKRIQALPHLFSSAFWYNKGRFFFATRHINSPQVSIWEMYNWKLVTQVNVEGKGFFVRTNPAIPYLWTDSGDSFYTFIDKRTLRVEKFALEGRVTHVEFSADGKYAYVSVIGKEGKLLIYDALNLKVLKSFNAKYPAGKYNFLMKSRKYYPYLLGREVFMEKCWGCHHQEKTAFGPSFRWIALNRTKDLIVSQILNPEKTAEYLGYTRSVMPKIELSTYELEAILAFMEGLKDSKLAKLSR